MKLTIKQQSFVDCYIQTGNATESYKMAGYKCPGDNTAGVNSHKLLKNTKIQKAIAERMAEKDKERIASQDEVLEYLTNVLRGKIKEEQVVVENTGDYTSKARHVKKQVTPKDRNKAAELLGKRYGIFNENLSVDMTAKVEIVDDIE